MSDPTLKERRVAKLEQVLADADRLMTAAQDDSVKNEVRRATRDIEEARHYLNEPDIDSGPSILRIVDFAGFR